MSFLSYTAGRSIDPKCYLDIGLWGQFINSHEQVRKDRATEFRNRIFDLTDPTKAEDCFEYKVYETSGSFKDFYMFYEINNQ